MGILGLVRGIQGEGGIGDIFDYLQVSLLLLLIIMYSDLPSSSLRLRSVFKYPSISRLTWWKSGRTKSAALPK